MLEAQSADVLIMPAAPPCSPIPGTLRGQAAAEHARQVAPCCASVSCNSCPAAQHVTGASVCEGVVAAHCGMLTFGDSKRPAAYCEQAALLLNRAHPA